MAWHFTITSEMRELGLTGNELLVYAVIAGYSANGQGCYYGSAAYMADLCGVTIRTARDLMHSLAGKGLVTKVDDIVNGVKVCRYQVVGGREKISPVGKNFPQGREKISPNNIIDNTPYVCKSDKSLLHTAPQGAASQSDILKKFEELGCDAAVLRDWVAARKGAKVTQSVLDGMQREARKAGISLAEAVRICAENSWRGFRADYLHKVTHREERRTVMQGMKETAAQLWGTDIYGRPLR